MPTPHNKGWADERPNPHKVVSRLNIGPVTLLLGFWHVPNNTMSHFGHMCVNRLVALIGFVLQIFVLLNKLSVGNAFSVPPPSRLAVMTISSDHDIML